MRTLMFVAIGSRGDVQPVIVLGAALQRAGYQVVLVAGQNFQQWIESRGLGFLPLRADMEVMMNSPEGKHWAEVAGKSPLAEARAMNRMLTAYAPLIMEDVMTHCPHADVLFSNLPTFGFVEAIAEKHNIPHLRIMFSPLTPTPDPRSTVVPALSFASSPLNILAGYMGIVFTYWIVKDMLHTMRQKLALPAWNWRAYIRAWNRVVALCGISPLLTPPDRRWKDKVHITGYWFDEDAAEWQAPAPLEAFLAAGEPPIYVGFGSMPNSDPQRTTHDIIVALERAGQRGIIYRGWAGLQATDVPDTVLLIDDVPHEWLLPRMKAAVNHGGAGTVAMTLRAGIPMTVVSHLGDQPYWGRRIHELGLGAKPIRRIDFNAQNLERAIETMINTPGMNQRIFQFSKQFRAETGVANAVAFIRRYLGDDASPAPTEKASKP